jgi:hypothetical protein
MAHELAVQGEQWPIEVSQGLGSLVRQRHVDDPAILLAAQPVDEACPLQPVNQAGNPRYNGILQAATIDTFSKVWKL